MGQVVISALEDSPGDCCGNNSCDAVRSNPGRTSDDILFNSTPERHQCSGPEKIINNFPLASGIIAVIDGRNIDDPLEAEKRVKSTIDELEVKMSKGIYSRYVIRAAGKMDLLFKEHGLMLFKKDDIRRFEGLYRDLHLIPLLTNLNNDFEKEYSGNEEKLKSDEELAVSQFKGLDTLLQLVYKAADGENISRNEIDRTLDSYLFGDTYMLSNDNRMGLLIIEPAFTMNDISVLNIGVSTIEDAVKKQRLNMALKAVSPVLPWWAGMRWLPRKKGWPVQVCLLSF